MSTATTLHLLFAARERIRAREPRWSRARVDPALITEAERAVPPPVRRAMVATENPCAPALDLGANARSVEGFGEADGRALIEALMAFAAHAGFVSAHRFQQGDVVVWDNLAVVHQATPFARGTEHRREVRTTVSCPPSVH